MARFMGHHPELLDALRAMGIELSNTQKVTIEIIGGHAPIVRVERFVDERTLDVLRSLSEYELVETTTSVEITADETREG